MPPTVSPTPPQLVSAGGRVAVGVFDRPFRSVNLEQARPRVAGLPLPRRLARLRLKRWQHFAVVTPRLFLGLAIVDAGFVRTSWCYAVDRGDGRLHEHRRLGPALDLRVARELWRDHCHARARGYFLQVDNRLDEGHHVLRVHIEARRGQPAIHATLRAAHELTRTDPLVVVLPVGDNRGQYTHKAPLPVSGWILVGEQRHEIDAEHSTALIDVHGAHYPHHTWWCWATCAGRDARGRRVALNLTRNVNRQDDTFNENGVWVDGRLHRLGPALFEFDREQILAPWRVRTRALDDAVGAVDLMFEPAGERSERVRLGPIRSAFHQPYGVFTGRIRVAGEELDVPGLYGVCEDHDTYW